MIKMWFIKAKKDTSSSSIVQHFQNSQEKCNGKGNHRCFNLERNLEFMIHIPFFIVDETETFKGKLVSYVLYNL